MHAFGFIRGQAEELTQSKLKHSDWHSSVFECNEHVVVVCGSHKVEWPSTIKCIASNSSRIFILTADGVVTAFCKSSRTFKDLEYLPKSRSLAANDDELFCVTGQLIDFLLAFLEESFVLSIKLCDIDNPKVHHPLSIKVKSVACGAGFTLFLTHSGSVFTKGIGRLVIF